MPQIEKNIEKDNLTEQIIGKAIQVHRTIHRSAQLKINHRGSEITEKL